ncbi:J domain-containing protein [Paraburkholderia sp. MM5384-R2]|uniref:J domain-containing protein n=1 Tax=Paraburkholderia sp. MM5384-R2 TaxID=2723097 RepID=UPI001616B905|nr:J domain-containing protein [Paraburkholderia sp. MM5384-R2]MBB5503579.1 hypothetical protein [Paraburkholderia sp. MM5384-R2]
MGRPHTHYDNLKVARNAPPEVIKAAYKALSQRYHPDKNNSPDATRIMKILNDAYAVLGDAEARRRYDETLSAEAAEPAPESANKTPKHKTSDFQNSCPGASEWVYTHKGFAPARPGAAPKHRGGWLWAGGILLVVLIRLLSGGNDHADSSAPTSNATAASSDTVSHVQLPTSDDHLSTAVPPILTSAITNSPTNSETASTGASGSNPISPVSTSGTQAQERSVPQATPQGDADRTVPSVQPPGTVSAAVGGDDQASQNVSNAPVLANRWAQASVQANAEIDAAYQSAVRSLPAVGESCPDSVVLRQTPLAAGPFKPVVVVLSQQCGFAISYWPETDEEQVTFERSEIDGWAGYCALPMGTKTVCTRNGQG